MVVALERVKALENNSTSCESSACDFHDAINICMRRLVEYVEASAKKALPLHEYQSYAQT